MTELNLLDGLQEVVEEAIELGNIDHSEESKGGGFKKVILPAGQYPMYLCQYVECGTQFFKGFQGAKGSYSKAVRYGFAVFDYNTLDDDGNPLMQVIGTGFPIKMSQNGKAEFFNLFNTMNYDKSKKHMAQFLGNKNSFVGTVEVKKSAKGVEFNTIKVTSLQPAMEGSFGKQSRVVLPEIDVRDYELLLWDNPKMAQWDSIRKGAEGVSAGDPKNFVQYSILQAQDFEGSAIDLMLREAGTDLTVQPKAEVEPAEDVVEDTEEVSEPKSEKVVPAAMPTMPME